MYTLYITKYDDVSLTWSADCRENILESTFMVRGSLSLHVWEAHATGQLELRTYNHEITVKVFKLIGKMTSSHLQTGPAVFCCITCYVMQNSCQCIKILDCGTSIYRKPHYTCRSCPPLNSTCRTSWDMQGCFSNDSTTLYTMALLDSTTLYTWGYLTPQGVSTYK